MCDPVSATALALSAGGTFLQSREANKNAKRVQNAKNATLEAQMMKQRQFADQGGVAFRDNANNQSSGSFEDQKNKTIEQTKQAFNDIRVQPDYSMTGSLASTPKNVVIARQNANNDAAAITNRDLEGSANLAGYGGALFNQDLGRSEFARLFGNIQDRAGGQARLMPLEIQAAGNNASKNPSLLPVLMKTAGMAMGMVGAGGGISSFGDKVVSQPLTGGAFGPAGALTTKPGLFTTGKALPGKIFGGLY